MSKEMIVSVNGREKKIAILDNGKVTEFYIERGEENAGAPPATVQARGSRASTLSIRALISMLRGMRKRSGLRRNLAQRALENLGRLAA